MTIDYLESAINKNLKLQVDYAAMKTSATAANSSDATSLSFLSSAILSLSIKAQNNLSLDYY